MDTTITAGALRRRIALLIAGAVVLASVLAGAQQASAAYSIGSFGGESVDLEGNPVTQAGAHPDITTEFTVSGVKKSDTSFKDVKVNFPPGLIMNPSAAPKCSRADVAGTAEGGSGTAATCAPASQVGAMAVALNFGTGPVLIPGFGVYNVEPPPGVPARFAANIASVVVNFDAEVRPGDNYAITAASLNTSQSLPLQGAEVTIWGVPSSPSHDALRVCKGAFGPPCEVRDVERPLTSAPGNCSAGLLSTSLELDSWPEPGLFKTASFDHDRKGNPISATGCENVPFNPKLTLRPQSTQADSPTAVGVSLQVPQSNDPGGLSTALLDETTVKLPAGMAVNPASVDGLAACTPAQIGLGTNDPVSCPDAAKIGSLDIDTPLLEDTMGGSVYLATQKDNPFGTLLALYLVAEGPGVIVKIPGRIDVDQQTGQLTASFDEAPQLPFEELRMHLKGGSRSALKTPTACGTYTTTASLSSWSADDPANPSAAETVTSVDSFAITSGSGGQPCPAPGFAPGLQAGSASPIAGEYSPFALRVTRNDGEAALGSIETTLPSGLLGKLAGVPYCSDAALAAISGNEGAASGQLASPSCPAASQVGKVTVGAGSGPAPYYLTTAKAYLAGPYKGAPLSLAVVAPVKAGPFDLGNVVVRNALRVDPVSARITAVSDPLPTMLHGIGLGIRDVRVEVDRPEFTLNPTGCEPKSTEAKIASVLGQSSALNQRFQVGACKALDFSPALKLKVSGGTKRGSYTKLRAELNAPTGQANIGKVSVALPHSIFLAQEHIKTICTRVQYAAKNCPAGSVYGWARAFTPLLEQPLEGPVYLRSSSNPLPDLVASLDGQIHIDLAGRIDSVNGGIRSTFEGVPDAPVSKFVLAMKGGRKSLLVNSRNLCAGTDRATVKMDGQNGKVHDFRPVVGNSCGKKAKKRK